MLQSLQSLRGIFAIFIFFHHFAYMRGGETMFGPGGDSGVAFFFILSGFVLMLAKKHHISSAKRPDPFPLFLTKRLAKIYPLHLVCLIWALILSREDLSIINISNIFLLQAWVPNPDWYFSGNAVGWCLSDFLFFYILFPRLSKWLISSPKCFIYCFLFIALIYTAAIIPFIPEADANSIIYINPLTRSLDFILGMTLSHIYSKLRGLKISNTNTLLLYFAAICFVILTIYLWSFLQPRYSLSIIWWPSMSFLILTFALGKVKTPLVWKPLVSFGDVSFSFYLIHVLTIRTFDIFTDKFHIFLPPLFRLVILIILSVAGAYIVSKLFVLPVKNHIMKLAGRLF